MHLMIIAARRQQDSIKQKKHAWACLLTMIRSYGKPFPYTSENVIFSEPLKGHCPFRHRMVLSHILFGKEKVAHGRATEASADHSIFTAVQTVKHSPCGEDLHLVTSLREAQSLLSWIFNF